MKKRVLILGDGVHRELYFQSLCFINDEIDITEGASCTGKETDIVVAEPFMLNQVLVQSIVNSGFSGTLIIEKMVAKSIDCLDSLTKQLNNCKLFISHRRLYSPPLPLSIEADNNVSWPNRYDTCMDPLWNTLPNIVDSLYVSFGGIRPYLLSAERKETEIELLFGTNTVYTNVRIYAGGEKEQVAVNGSICAWPNAFQNIQETWNKAHVSNPYDSIAHTKWVHQIILQAKQMMQYNTIQRHEL